MIYGSLYFMTDAREALMAVMHDHYKIAVISEEWIQGIDPNSADVIQASCLLPPPVAKMAEIDGDAERFYGIYNEYLLSDVPVDFISIILGYLHQGGNMIFYITCGLDEPWVIQLCNHIMNYYGIIIGSDDVLPGYNPAFNDSNNNIIYAGGMISPEEYLRNKSPNFPIQPWILDLLESQIPTPAYEQNPIRYYEEMSSRLKFNPESTLAVSFRNFRR